MEKVAIVLPAHNEALTVAGTMKAFHEQLPDAFIVVVDNNSSDQTGAIARQALGSIGARGVILEESRPGKGFAVRRALKAVDAEIYVLCDADETYPASQVGTLLHTLRESGADMVVGDRHSSGGYEEQNRRTLHVFGNRLVTYLVNKLFRADLADIMSGFRVMSRQFVKNYPILVNGFELETDMTLHALDKRLFVVEVPVHYIERPQGSESKLSTVKDGAKVLFVILQLLRYYRPMLFFGAIAFVFFVLGLLAGVLPVLDYLREQYVYHVPLAILAMGLEICALMSLAIALILDSIRHSNRLQFERGL